MFVIKNSKPISPTDRVRFHCKRCGECCRHVEGSVLLDSLDGYRLAKHLQMEVSDFYLHYGDYFILDEASHFPLYALKVRGDKNQCVFLEGNRCTVREARPGTCRMYPFWVEPTDASGAFNINYSFEQRQHERGRPIRVRDWLNDNLDAEKCQALCEEFRTVTTLAPLLYKANQLGISPNRTERLLLYYRFLNFDTRLPYMAQMVKNNAMLIAQITALIHEQTGTQPKGAQQ